MNRDLKDSATEYCLSRDPMTNAYPISMTDAKIIDQLIQITKKTDKELSRILSQYKTVHDADILEALQSYNDQVDEVGEKSKGKKDVVIPWIDIDGRSFVVPFLVSFEKNEQYKEDRLWNTIIINKGPLPSAHCNYEDTVLFYNSIEQRDREYETLKAKLSGTGKIKFI